MKIVEGRFDVLYYGRQWGPDAVVKDLLFNHKLSGVRFLLRNSQVSPMLLLDKVADNTLVREAIKAIKEGVNLPHMLKAELLKRVLLTKDVVWLNKHRNDLRLIGGKDHEYILHDKLLTQEQEIAQTLYKINIGKLVTKLA